MDSGTFSYFIKKIFAAICLQYPHFSAKMKWIIVCPEVLPYYE